MIRPDDESAPFVSRWSTLVRVLLVEPSVKLVARSAMDYANFEDGSNCHPSNERLARDTGYNEKTVRDAWSVLRALDMAIRVSGAVSYDRKADKYQLVIPDDWKSLPLLGPRGRKFTCLGCQKPFNPRAHQVQPKAGERVRWVLHRFVFCAAGRGEQYSACMHIWDARRKAEGKKPWLQDTDRWPFFHQARGDDW